MVRIHKSACASITPDGLYVLAAAGVGGLFLTLRAPDGTWGKFGDIRDPVNAGTPGSVWATACAGIGGSLYVLAVTTPQGGLFLTARAPDGTWGKFGDVKDPVNAGNPGKVVATACAGIGDSLYVLAVTFPQGGLFLTARAPDGTWGQFGDVKDPRNAGEPPEGQGPPPPPPPASIDYLKADPNNGYINLGTSATLSWRVSNTQPDTRASLQGRVGLGGSGETVLNKANAGLQGSQNVTPHEDTLYTLTVTDNRGAVSVAKWVTIYVPPSPPPGSVFYFKMTNPQSVVTRCFTIAIYAKDKDTAKRMAEQQNGGYQAESIDSSQFMSACG